MLKDQIDDLEVGQSLKDEEIQGLTLKRNSIGYSWMLYYRNRAGQQRRPKVGSYPLISIATARKAARQLLTRVALGEDPSAERKALLNDPTLSEFWHEVKSGHYNRNTTWDKEAERIFKTMIEPTMGSMKLTQIHVADIATLQARYQATTYAANRALAVLAQMMTLAVRWRYRADNPGAAVRPYGENKRRRFASPQEIQKILTFLNTIDADHKHYRGRIVIEMILFTGARPQEILKARPGQLTEGVLRVPGKNGEDRAIFVPPVMNEFLKDLDDDRPWLCGTNVSPRGLWDQVIAATGIDGLWMRDLRRTFATVGLSNKVTAGAVGELLGHKSAQTTKIYAKLFEDEGKQITADIADRILAYVNPEIAL
jgi:integrase